MTTLPRPVNADHSALSRRLNEVRERIAGAARRCGRESGGIRLVGIVKTVASEVVESAIALGLEDLGENRVQEAEARIGRLGGASEGGRVAWHLVGHLQRNKAGRAARLFDRVHTVDGVELAFALARHAQAAGRELRVLIEVNVAAVARQFGVAPAGLAALAAEVAKLPGLRLDGLMTVGPAVKRAEEARPTFSRLRELRDSTARELGIALPELSMGMSGDFEVAIEEGSTLVRIGRALFGARD